MALPKCYLTDSGVLISFVEFSCPDLGIQPSCLSCLLTSSRYFSHVLAPAHRHMQCQRESSAWQSCIQSLLCVVPVDVWHMWTASQWHRKDRVWKHCSDGFMLPAVTMTTEMRDGAEFIVPNTPIGDEVCALTCGPPPHCSGCLINMTGGCGRRGAGSDSSLCHHLFLYVAATTKWLPHNSSQTVQSHKRGIFKGRELNTFYCF